APAPADRQRGPGPCPPGSPTGAPGSGVGIAPPPPHLSIVWVLTKRPAEPLRNPVAYAVATDGKETHCTCPDHVHNGATCKHINALISLHLLPAAPVLPRKEVPAAPPVPPPNGRLEEGWQPGGKALPVPSPEGFREAVRD